MLEASLPPIEPGAARGRAHVASAEFLAPDALALVRQRGRLTALDVHDDQILQITSLGLDVDPVRLAEIRSTRDASLDAFRWHVANSNSFARLAGLERRRVIIAPNGTDPAKVVPGPWPETPTIGLVSGAAPGRGIELVVAAAELLRVELPGLQVLLALASTGPESEQYLADLRGRLARSSWIRFATAPYDQLGALLGEATVLCVPHPPSPYWDAVQPIKLFDSMAAGRPIATTPRTATVAVVEHAHAGVVARGKSASDFAQAIGPVLADRALAERLGRNARQAVVRDYDWQVISSHLSATLQLRTDPFYVPRTLARSAWRRVRPAKSPGAP